MKTPCNKTSTGITGVSRIIKYDKRKDKSYLCYTVFWIKDGKPRNKTFQVGNVKTVTADQEFHAFRTAVLFRKSYEYAIDNDRSFDDSLFRNWRSNRLYELQNLSDAISDETFSLRLRAAGTSQALL